MTTPTDAAIAWEGVFADFGLVGACSQFFANTPPAIGASIVSWVDGSCETGDTVAVGTAAEAVAALADARGVAISAPSGVTLGGHVATRFEIAPDARMCFDEVPLWNGFDIGRGLTIIYVVDVGASPLAVTITDGGGAERAPAIAEAEAIVASLQIDVTPGAQPSREPVPTPEAGCLQFDGTGTYTAPAGQLSVTATLPDDPGIHWSGGRDWFDLRRSPCGFDAPLSFGALVVTSVAVDACRGMGDSVEVRTAAEAATALAGQASTSVTGRTDLTIDGNPAVRLEISPMAGLETTTCDEGATLLLGQTAEDPFIRIDWTYTVYLIDIEGSIVAIVPVLDGVDGAEDPALLAEVDAIIGSLEIRALGGPGS